MKRKNCPSLDTVKEFEEALSRPTAAERYVLSLFVAGSSPKSLRAIRNIRSLCEKRLGERYDLRVIDIYQHPERAKQDQIAVTPTLIRNLPLPLRALIGDLSSEDRLLLGLDIACKNAAL